MTTTAPRGTAAPTARRTTGPGTRRVAETLAPLLDALLGSPLPLQVRCWDGSSVGPDDSAARVVVRSPMALRRILWAPGELGVARAHVAGDLDVEGDVEAGIAVMRHADLCLGPAQLPILLAAARDLDALGPPPAPPPEEVVPLGLRHSRRRDAAAITHHYDVDEAFYRLVLGPAMTYSCARFVEPGMGLEAAQAAKHELICRKLGLHRRPGLRLLDVGCGWGAMAIHAARHHGAQVLGITISRAQASAARRRVHEAGVADLVEIRLQDYRQPTQEVHDAISSIGMSEHVGESRIDAYFEVLARQLRPGGRLLNHAISSPGGSRLGRRSFMARYVFPDGELLDVARTVSAAERAGLEVRDVESLREHYAMTLRCWVANLQAGWDEAVDRVGERRARVWRLYMAASAEGFGDGGNSLHQVLAVRPHADGRSAMPLTRAGWG